MRLCNLQCLVKHCVIVIGVHQTEGKLVKHSDHKWQCHRYEWVVIVCVVRSGKKYPWVPFQHLARNWNVTQLQRVWNWLRCLGRFSCKCGPGGAFFRVRTLTSAMIQWQFLPSCNENEIDEWQWQVKSLKATDIYPSRVLLTNVWLQWIMSLGLFLQLRTLAIRHVFVYGSRCRIYDPRRLSTICRLDPWCHQIPL